MFFGLHVFLKYFVLVCCLLLSFSAQAKKKYPKRPSKSDALNALFDTLPNPQKSNLEESLKGIKFKKEKNALILKEKEQSDVSFHEAVKVYTAERISMNSKNSCAPKKPRKKWVMTYFVEGFPAISQEFAVCLEIFAVKAHDVSIHVEILDPNKKKVAHAESFMHLNAGKNNSLIIRYKDLELNRAGKYSYKIEINRETAKELPLAEFKALE